MYYVYMMECEDTSIYTGITTDVERRLAEHKAGKASHYTSARKAKKLLRVEEHPDRGAALKREAQIKSWTRAQKLSLISSGRMNT
jgi:putative endonuclease